MIEETKMITAEELAKEFRAVSVSEFFTRNRHLLGFDNATKALLTVVKEAVDNSLDATEEARILPEILIDIKQVTEDRFLITVEDNGPGIVKEHIPNVFASLLFGSKFHRLRQSLTKDQEIIIKENGKVSIVKIGDFIDRFLKNNETEKNILKYNIKVPSFDWKDYRSSFKKVSHVIRHEVNEDIYKIKTEYGRESKVTGCHSLFTLDKDTLKVKEVEVKELRNGDYIIGCKHIQTDDNVNIINILDYFELEDIKRNWWYVYGIKREFLKNLFSKSEIIHKSNWGKSRKFYRFYTNGKVVDVLDDSYKQYLAKEFMPIQLVFDLNAIKDVVNCRLRTYQHGKVTEIPIRLELNNSIMRILGFYVAEGHTHLRDLVFDFGGKEKEYITEVKDFASKLDLNVTIKTDKRNKTRVIVHSGALSYLFKKLCNTGAKNKNVPEFLFRVNKVLRQNFLDALIQGDGHNFKDGNELILSSVSKGLIKEINYLWLLQGVVAGLHKPKYSKGFGKKPSLNYKISIFGNDLNQSYVFNRKNVRSKDLKYNMIPNSYLWFNRNKKNILVNNRIDSLYQSASLGFSKDISNKYAKIFSSCQENQIYTEGDLVNAPSDRITKTHLNWLNELGYFDKIGPNYIATNKIKRFLDSINKLQKFKDSDLCLLKVKSVERIDRRDKFVYDISTPNCENFISGNGVVCHNSRGVQGIGISASVMYGQLTTGKSAKIISKVKSKKKAQFFELHIDTKTNRPDIVKEEELDWDKPHGTRVEIEIEGKYQKGRQSVEEYLKETAIVNPHMQLIYNSPKGEKFEFPRASNELPKDAKEIKPHPYGIELGILMNMLRDTKTKTLSAFLINEFSRVSAKVAKQICEKAKLYEKGMPNRIARQEADNLMRAIRETKIMAPPTNCLSPLSEELILKGLKKEIEADFYASVTRPPNVYRGNPFQISAGIAYGGGLIEEELVRVMRFANRVPLLYQQSACAIIRSIINTAWKNYGLSQSKGALPSGPAVVLVHIASVWVPFTSESKEAIAHYPEIIKEIKLALQECGRKLAGYIRKQRRIEHEKKRKSIFERYVNELVDSLDKITKVEKERIIKDLLIIANKSTLGGNE